MVSTLQPFSNYTQFLCRALLEQKADLVVFSDKDIANTQLDFSPHVSLVWNKNPKFMFQILKALLSTKPKIVHYQHEINMFGGTITAIQFPILVFLTRLLGIKVVTTLHSAVPLKKVDVNFIKFFLGNNAKLPPIMLKVAFFYINFLTGLFSNKILAHTNFLKDILVHDYLIPASKIEVIPHGVTIFERTHASPSPEDAYFFYFGYIAKRKGLDAVLRGYARYLETSKNPIKLILGGGIIPSQEFAFEEVKKLVDDLKLANLVSYTGFLSEVELKKYFFDAYAILIPATISIAASGPLALALGFGKSVVASNVDNLNEELAEILVNNFEWEKAFDYLERNPQKVADLEKLSRLRADERSWLKMARRHIKVYEEL